MTKSSKKGIYFGAKVVALPVIDAARANRFYGEVLGLPVAYEDEEPCGYLLGETILLLKPDWYAPPSAEPSPRITLLVDDARDTNGPHGTRSGHCGRGGVGRARLRRQLPGQRRKQNLVLFLRLIAIQGLIATLGIRLRSGEIERQLTGLLREDG